MRYYKCRCGCDSFIRTYNVYNIEVRVRITEKDGEEYWDEEYVGKEKDHFCGFICKDCRQDIQELNDGI